MLRRSLICLVPAGIISGCATSSKITNPEKYLIGKSVGLIPTGQVLISSESNMTAGLFGVVGFLAEAALSESSRKNWELLVTLAKPPEDYIKIAQETIVIELRKWNTKSIIKLERTLNAAPLDKWYEQNPRMDLRPNLAENVDFAIDYGLHNMVIMRGGSDDAVQFGVRGSLAVRLIDPKSGIVIGRAIDTSHKLINRTPQNADFGAEAASAFEDISKEATRKALMKLFG